MNAFEKGMELEKQGKNAEAWSFFQEAALEHPESYLAWTHISFNLVELGDNALEALQAAEQALGIYPGYAYAWFMKARVLHQLGRSEQAMTALNQALFHDPNFALAYGGKASILGQQGRLDEAIVECDRALKIDSHLRSALFIKVGMLGQLKRLAEVPSLADRLLFIGQNSPQETAMLITLKAAALAQMSRSEEALQAIDQALLQSEYPSSENLTIKGEILIDLGRIAEACEVLEYAVRINPQDREAQEAFNSIRHRCK